MKRYVLKRDDYVRDIKRGEIVIITETRHVPIEQAIEEFQRDQKAGNVHHTIENDALCDVLYGEDKLV